MRRVASEYSLRRNLRALPRPVWILFGGTFINRFGRVVMPFLIIWLTRQATTPRSRHFDRLNV